MVVFGVLDERQAAQAVDYHTLALLLGMMIVVANLRLSGAFARFARAMLERAQSGYGMLAMTVASVGSGTTAVSAGATVAGDSISGAMLSVAAGATAEASAGAVALAGTRGRPACVPLARPAREPDRLGR